jgi:U1 small nuclear ribonucleoprotein C
VRKTHCTGRKHKENVRDYYQKWMEEQAQRLIDQTTAAFKSGKIAPGMGGFPRFGMPPPGMSKHFFLRL